MLLRFDPTSDEIYKAYITYFHVIIIISVFLTIFNLIVAKKLKEQTAYSKYLSFISIAIILLVGSPLDFSFATAILISWLLYYKKIKNIKINNLLVLKYAVPLLISFWIYDYYISSQYKKAKKLEDAVYHNTSYNELKAMLDNGYNPNIQNETGYTPLFYARHPEKAVLLLEYGADPNFEGPHLDTPITAGKTKDNYNDYFTVLIYYGADINHINSEGNTVLHEAAYWGRDFIFEAALPHNPDLSIKNKNGMTAVEIAKKEYKKHFYAQYPSEYNLQRAMNILELLSKYTDINNGLIRPANEHQLLLNPDLLQRNNHE